MHSNFNVKPEKTIDPRTYYYSPIFKIYSKLFRILTTSRESWFEKVKYLKSIFHFNPDNLVLSRASEQKPRKFFE